MVNDLMRAKRDKMRFHFPQHHLHTFSHSHKSALLVKNWMVWNSYGYLKFHLVRIYEQLNFYLPTQINWMCEVKSEITQIWVNYIMEFNHFWKCFYKTCTKIENWIIPSPLLWNFFLISWNKHSGCKSLKWLNDMSLKSLEEVR